MRTTLRPQAVVKKTEKNNQNFSPHRYLEIESNDRRWILVKDHRHHHTIIFSMIFTYELVKSCVKLFTDGCPTDSSLSKYLFFLYFVLGEILFAICFSFKDFSRRFEISRTCRSDEWEEENLNLEATHEGSKWATEWDNTDQQLYCLIAWMRSRISHTYIVKSDWRGDVMNNQWSSQRKNFCKDIFKFRVSSWRFLLSA